MTTIFRLQNVKSFLSTPLLPHWFCYGFFMERGWTLEVINKILGNFQRTAGLFIHTLFRFWNNYMASNVDYHFQSKSDL